MLVEKAPDDQRPYPWGTAAPTTMLAVFSRAYNATERGASFVLAIPDTAPAAPAPQA